MVAINTILIIVNGGPPNAFEHQQITTNAGGIGELFAIKGGKLAGLYSKRSVNHFHDWLARFRG
jgi:hypothetical protein